MRLSWLIILCIGLCWISCSKKGPTHFTYPLESNNKNILKLPLDPEYRSPCKDPLNYIPDSSVISTTKSKIIRLNFHIVDDSLGGNNFSITEAPTFMKNMVNNANYRLGKNDKMNLPENNDTPVYDPFFRYKITGKKEDKLDDGIYFHKDNEDAFFINKGRNKTNYKKNIIKKYALDDDRILNVFILPIHPDSFASKTYKSKSSGIALGSSVKLGGLYQLGGADWKYATLLNHEIGHVYSLSHAWGHDRCDDTPRHANCYHNTGKSPCDGTISNNVMDYNNSQMAYSPCQLGRMHLKMNDTSSFQRKLLQPNWCELDSSKIITINKEEEWLGGRDIAYNVEILPQGQLTIHCRLGIPKDGTITVHPGGKLILKEVTLHNDCDQLWNGIKVLKEKNVHGMVEQHGKVKILNIKGFD